MSAPTTNGLLTACAIGFLALSGAAHAEGGIGADKWHVFAPGTPACPGMSWHFRLGGGSPYGYIWYNDASGISRATGTLDTATGVFRLNVVSLDGKGPTGIVTGVRNANGTVEATMKGEGCANAGITHPRQMAEPPVPVPAQ